MFSCDENTSSEAPIEKKDLKKTKDTQKEKLLKRKSFSTRECSLLLAVLCPLENLKNSPVVLRMKSVAQKCIELRITSSVWSSNSTTIHQAVRVLQAVGLHIAPPFSQEMITTYI